jgi:hypothetical protein
VLCVLAGAHKRYGTLTSFVSICVDVWMCVWLLIHVIGRSRQGGYVVVVVDFMPSKRAWRDKRNHVCEHSIAHVSNGAAYLCGLCVCVPSDNPFKRDSDKYTGAVRWIKRELKTWVPECEPKYWIVGGHSAGRCQLSAVPPWSVAPL